MKTEKSKLEAQQEQLDIPVVSNNNFIVKINDTFCELEYGFTLDNTYIKKLIKT